MERVVLAHQESDGQHHVLAALHVLVYPSESSFIAQGLEIDYVSSGRTREEAQDNFVRGLIGTVQATLERNRPLGGLFKSKAPPEIWQAYIDSKEQDRLTCAATIDLREKLPPSFPFGALAYCQTEQPAYA